MAESQGAAVWKIAAAAATLVGIGATVCAYQRNAEAVALRGQLGTKQQQLTEARQQLTAARRQLAADQTRIASEARPDLPIKLTFRPSPLRQGEVALMENLSSRTLEVTLDIKGATGAHFTHTLVINPGQMGHFGPQDGWAFAAGQILTLSNPAYRPISQAVGG